MKLPSTLTNILFVYSANAINGILGIVAIPLVISALGSDQYGIFSIYTILASYIALIDLGVTKHFVRLMSTSNEPDNHVEHLQKALGWFIILSLILLLFLPVLSLIVTNYLFPVDDRFVSSVKWIVNLSVIDYIIAIPVVLVKAYTISNHEFKKYSTFMSVTNGIKYALMFFAALKFRNPVIVVLFLILRRVFELIFAYFILPAPPKNAWRPRISFVEFKNILINSSVLSLAHFLQSTVYSIGVILINRHFGIATMGNYKAAFDLASKLWFFSNGIGIVVFPKFSQILSDKNRRDTLYVKLKLYLEKSFISYLLISGLAIISASWLLPLIKLNNEQIIFYFKLLIFGVCLNAHTNVSYEYLLADNRYKTVAYLSFGILIVIITSYFLLKDMSGIYAIGWAWIISQTIFAFTTDELVLKQKRVPDKSLLIDSIIKIIIFSLALLCLIAEVRYSGLKIHLIVSVFFIAGIVLLLKDYQDVKLIFK